MTNPSPGPIGVRNGAPSAGLGALALLFGSAAALTGTAQAQTSDAGQSAAKVNPAASCAQPAAPDFGPNVHIFDPSMSSATIQSQLDSQFNQMKDTATAQFSENRVADLFEPGSYSVEDNVGVLHVGGGSGSEPGRRDDQRRCDRGRVQRLGRGQHDAELLAVGGEPGDQSGLGHRPLGGGAGRPFRRIDVHGDLALYPASYGYASGGYIADTKVTGQAASVSQQQWYTRDSTLGSWAGGVEHGLLRCERRAGHHLPHASGDDAGDHPGLP